MWFRRQLILGIVAGLTIPTAGCLGDDATDDVPEEDPELEIIDTDFGMADSVTAPPDEQIPWGWVDIENSSAANHGPVQTEFRFYDSNESLLETRDGYTHVLPGNRTWRDYFRYYTETPDAVDYVEASIVDKRPNIGRSELAGVDIIRSEKTVEPEGGVELTAEIEIGDSAPDQVTVVGLFYDGEERFRGTIRDVSSETGDTVAVSAGTIGIRTPPDFPEEEVTSHELLIFEGNV